MSSLLNKLSLFHFYQIKSFKDYVGLYLKARDDDEDLPVDDENPKKSNSVVHEVVNKRWEVCITTSMKGFQQASFVNSIATTKVLNIHVVHCSQFDLLLHPHAYKSHFN